MKASDKLAIFENVLARVGMEGDILREYHKAISSLNGFTSYQEMQPPPMPQNTAVPSANMPVSPTISPAMGNNPTQPPMV
jgi:hypothetical protein